MPDSIYANILEAVKTQIADLSLSGISAANILVGKIPSDRPDHLPALPGILIAPFAQKRLTPTQGTNVRDDVEYPVLVVAIQAGNQSQTADFDRMLLWHEKIISRFHLQRLPGVTSVWTCYTDPRDVFDAPAWFRNFDASGIVFRFVSRDPRG